MDKAARAFALDPIDIRRRNLIDKFPYKSAMGLEYDEATYKETLEMAVKAIDVPAFRQATGAGAVPRARYLGIGFATFSERTGYGSPAFAARGMEITPGWETVIITVDPSGFVEGAHRFVAARTRPAHDLGADHRRRDRCHAGNDQSGAWRHRPRALRMGARLPAARW
jgi:CO/xanthine dehydrogenase Mo-binding subunit